MCEFGGGAHTERPRQLPRVFLHPPHSGAPREIRDCRIYKYTCAPRVPYFPLKGAFGYRNSQRACAVPLPLFQMCMRKINTGVLRAHRTGTVISSRACALRVTGSTSASHDYRTSICARASQTIVILVAHHTITVPRDAYAHLKYRNVQRASYNSRVSKSACAHQVS